MLETFVITFREGLEMFLIVAIILAYLSKTGRTSMKRAVYWGIGVAILISVTTGWHIAELAQDPFMEGAFALSAGVLVASMTYMVMRSAKNIRKNIHNKVDRTAEKGGLAAIVGMFLFTVIMISREGMESAMMLGSLSSALSIGDLFFGVVMGFGAVAVIGNLWISQSERINLRVFMQVTGIFLMLFCVHLFLYGFHEITEVQAVPFIDNVYWHTLTEPLEPGEPIGDLISLVLLAIPCAWIGINYYRNTLLDKQAMNAAE